MEVSVVAGLRASFSASIGSLNCAAKPHFNWMDRVVETLPLYLSS